MLILPLTDAENFGLLVFMSRETIACVTLLSFIIVEVAPILELLLSAVCKFKETRDVPVVITYHELKYMLPSSYWTWVSAWIATDILTSIPAHIRTTLVAIHF